MRVRRTLLAATTVALLALAACGDDGGDDDAGETGAVDATADVTIELTDNVFSPDSVEVTGGETITVALENTGSVPHTFTGDDVDEELAPGESTTVSVDIPADGDGFEFFCRFHQGAGMTGDLTTSGTTSGGPPADEPVPTDEPVPGGGPGY